MSNTELIKELRLLTAAGMKDCKDALEEANWDLQKAVDIVKIKGQNISDGRSGRAATEGRIAIEGPFNGIATMCEVNCQTDFVSSNGAFVDFAQDVAASFYDSICNGTSFSLKSPLPDGSSFMCKDIEAARILTVSIIKENIVVRRWWAEQAQDPTVRIFAYLHSNDKIGVLLTMQAPSVEAANSKEFADLGSDLTMQICAMNPLGVSSDRIPLEEVDRQRVIFETQLKEDAKPKPEAMWPKIIDGKLSKWYKDVCLLEQESVISPKTTVNQVIKNVGSKLGGDIQIINFVRAEVGAGLEIKQSNLAEEVAKLM